ncbi:hypothetical protein SAMN06295924_105173 [Rathayibacter rathayi NCPPB 2980 = VKM Ac-1601]|nr:hypothetical protein FB469_0157 [Rathayibacter rathayi]SOE04815.1 hypothetical protein SAMN06295924_105173 [Rathayibacter rathayi NCPPB 2980 = VKM Ac-1601]
MDRRRLPERRGPAAPRRPFIRSSAPSTAQLRSPIRADIRTGLQSLLGHGLVRRGPRVRADGGPLRADHRRGRRRGLLPRLPHTDGGGAAGERGRRSRLGATLEKTWPPEHEAWAQRRGTGPNGGGGPSGARGGGREPQGQPPRAAAPPRLRARPPPPRDARRDPRPRPRPQRRPVGRSPTRSTATTPAPPPRTERSEAQRAVRHLVQVIDERTAATARALGPDVLAAMHLRRVLVRLHHDGA